MHQNIHYNSSLQIQTLFKESRSYSIHPLMHPNIAEPKITARNE